MARIAIDARKWRDYGIGTYVRNIVRALALLDHENTYFLFCHHEDVPTLTDLSENFVPVVDSRRVFMGLVRRKAIIEYAIERFARSKAQP